MCDRDSIKKIICSNSNIYIYRYDSPDRNVETTRTARYNLADDDEEFIASPNEV